MNKIVMAAALIFSLSPAWAGKDVGNGGGIGEKYILHAYLNLTSYIDVCLSSRVCGLTTEEQNLLLKIKYSLSEEYKTKNQIEFRSARKLQNFFKVDGLIRIAKTGDAIGEKIYVNSDQLYTDDSEPINLGMAVAVLVHEFGHHHNVKDHTKLDVLGLKVAKAVSDNTLQAKTRFPKILTISYFESADGYREFLISNGKAFKNVTSEIEDGWSPACKMNGKKAPYFVTEMHWGLPVLINGRWIFSVQMTVFSDCFRFPSKSNREVYGHNFSLTVDEDLQVPSWFREE